jgi:hypothetical protein
MGSRSIISKVNNLGNLYKDQGKLDEAGKVYQRRQISATQYGILPILSGHLDEAKDIFRSLSWLPGSPKPIQR